MFYPFFFIGSCISIKKNELYFCDDDDDIQSNLLANLTTKYYPWSPLVILVCGLEKWLQLVRELSG